MVITVKDALGAAPPTIDDLRVTIRASAQIRNFPAACAPSTAVSPSLIGNFGPASISFVSVLADDPDDFDELYSAGGAHGPADRGPP